MRVRLTRKLANALNGLDLRQFAVGEVIDLPDGLAQMLVAEDWAETFVEQRATAADQPPPRRITRRQ